MKHEIFRPSTRQNQSDTAASVRHFLQANKDDLWRAAHLLGGGKAAKSVSQLVDDLGQPGTVSRKVGLRLDALLALLCLEHVGDPDRPEAGYFSAIDPADPVVDDICLLTDGLAKAIGEMRI
jgi:hypothetical protein